MSTSAEISATVGRLAAALCNWERWGADDQLGTLNLVTPAKRTEAAAAVRDGKVFSLGFELREDAPQPPGSGRMNAQHLMRELPTDAGDTEAMTAGADDILIVSVHAATHWDALSHIFHHDQMYGGRPASLVGAFSGATRNDIVPVAREMVTRGVLADVPRYLGLDVLPPGHAVTPDELQNTLDSQGVELRDGDAILIRTGRLGTAKAAEDWGDYTSVADRMPLQAGVGVECLPLLHERGVAALAADNWAVERLDATLPRFPLHEVSLVYMGMILGENFELDALAGACADDGRYEFMLAAAPLPIGGGVGGPVNPIVLR
jgi:kynurenine formamidase